jgi:predicted nucleotidyltransferase
MTAMRTPAEGLARLREAAATGALDDLCARHRIRGLTVFGSAGRGEAIARDLDVGVLFEFDAEPDLLGLIAELGDLTGADNDVVHLNRGGPVIRERALVGSIWLYESMAGALTDAMVTAVAERIDTDRLRWLNLELLAE